MSFRCGRAQAQWPHRLSLLPRPPVAVRARQCGRQAGSVRWSAACAVIHTAARGRTATAGGSRSRCLSPAPAPTSSAPGRLSAGQLERWRRTGFLVVDNLWPESLVGAAGAEIEALLPPHTDLLAPPEIPGSDGLVVLPTTARGEAAPETALNALPVCPGALAVISQLLEVSSTSDIRLSQCHVSIKRGRLQEPESDGEPELSGDQDLHLDFHDNMMLVPGRSPPPAVAALCYYSDVEVCAGATHVSPTPTSAAEMMVGASESAAATSPGLCAEDIPPPGEQRNAWTLRWVGSFEPRWHRVGTVWVAHDYFAVDGVRIPCDAVTSASVAAHFGGRLPNPEEVHRCNLERCRPETATAAMGPAAR